jgi:hypothetical protein
MEKCCAYFHMFLKLMGRDDGRFHFPDMMVFFDLCMPFGFCPFLHLFQRGEWADCKDSHIHSYRLIPDSQHFLLLASCEVALPVLQFPSDKQHPKTNCSILQTCPGALGSRCLMALVRSRTHRSPPAVVITHGSLCG